MGDLFVETPAATKEKQSEKASSENTKRATGNNEKDNEEEKNVATVYSHDEAVVASIEYFGGDELAARVWASKYALKDSFGNLY